MWPQLLDPRPYFADLPDPRRESRSKLHPLHDILMIVLCAVLSGVEDWVGMEAFAEEKEAWLRGFLGLPNGIPSHDTLSDVLGRIDPVAFRAGLHRLGDGGLARLGGRASVRGWQGGPGQSRRDHSGGSPSECLRRSSVLGLDAAGGGGEIQRDHRHPGPAGAAGFDRCGGLQ